MLPQLPQAAKPAASQALENHSRVKSYNRGELTVKTLADPASRRVVESRQNARVKELRAAFRRAAPTADGRLAIEGEHLLQEAAKRGLRFHTIFVATGHEDLLTGLPQAETLVVSQD